MGELELVIERERSCFEEEGERRRRWRGGGEVYGGGDRKKGVDRGNSVVREGAGEVQGGGFDGLRHVFV